MLFGLRCRVRRDARGREVRVDGALTARTRGRLMAKLHALAVRRQEPITVDVSRLSYFDSVSLTMLLGTERVLERQYGCPVEIRGLDTATFRLTGLDLHDLHAA